MSDDKNHQENNKANPPVPPVGGDKTPGTNPENDIPVVDKDDRTTLPESVDFDESELSDADGGEG